MVLEGKVEGNLFSTASEIFNFLAPCEPTQFSIPDFEIELSRPRAQGLTFVNQSADPERNRDTHPWSRTVSCAYNFWSGPS